MRARYYNPEIKRFINQDILLGSIADSTSLNRFSYVNGNLVNLIDPFGLEAQRTDTGDIDWAYYDELYKTKGIGYIPKSIQSEYLGSVRDVEWYEDPTTYIGGVGSVAGRGLFKGLLSGLFKKTSSKNTDTLYHYTNKQGLDAITESKLLNPSIKQKGKGDVTYGNGQYLTDIKPDSVSSGTLMRKLFGIGNPRNKTPLTNYLEIDVTGLDIKKGRKNVYVIPNDNPLDITNRLKSYGQTTR